MSLCLVVQRAYTKNIHILSYTPIHTFQCRMNKIYSNTGTFALSFSAFFLECVLQSLQYKVFTCKLYSLQGSIISNGKSFKPCPKPQGFQPSQDTCPLEAYGQIWTLSGAQLYYRHSLQLCYFSCILSITGFTPKQ